jgi:hypothetical protein
MNAGACLKWPARRSSMWTSWYVCIHLFVYIHTIHLFIYFIHSFPSKRGNGVNKPTASIALTTPFGDTHSTRCLYPNFTGRGEYNTNSTHTRCLYPHLILPRSIDEILFTQYLTLDISRGNSPTTFQSAFSSPLLLRPHNFHTLASLLKAIAASLTRALSPLQPTEVSASAPSPAPFPVFSLFHCKSSSSSSSSNVKAADETPEPQKGLPFCEVGDDSKRRGITGVFGHQPCPPTPHPRLPPTPPTPPTPPAFDVLQVNFHTTPDSWTGSGEDRNTDINLPLSSHERPVRTEPIEGQPYFFNPVLLHDDFWMAIAWRFHLFSCDFSMTISSLWCNKM